MADPAASPLPPPRRFSVRRSLVAVVLACTLPAIAVVGWLVYVSFDTKRDLLEDSTTSLAREVMARLERDLAVIESALKLLATSAALQEGNLVAFQRQAEAALPTGIVLNYVLTDAAGRQVVNTLIPAGQPLPQTGTPAALQRVFTEGDTVLTDLFMGPVTQMPTIAMGVPVFIAGEIRYSLNVGLQPQRINQTLAHLDLPEGWVVAVIDRAGTITGRNKDSDRFVGQKAVAELRAALHHQPEGRLRARTKDGYWAITAHLSSPRWGWGVAVGAPEAELYGSLIRQGQLAGLGILVTFVGGVGLAWRLSRRILVSLHQLNRQAQAIVDGRPDDGLALQMVEASDVSVVMQRASAAMNTAVFKAEHDPLTGLGNRAYLDAQAPRLLSLAARLKLPLAVVMLDLDGFKAVNDLHGHAAGDRVLHEAAQRILAEVRSEDLVARLGGDEFCIVLNHTDPATAEQTAQRIVQSLSRPYAGIDTPVGCSAGLVRVPTGTHHLAAPLDAADRALYRAKQAGKGRVETADEAQTPTD